RLRDPLHLAVAVTGRLRAPVDPEERVAMLDELRRVDLVGGEDLRVAHPRLAGGARRRARTAMGDVDREIGLASVRRIAVAIGKALIADLHAGAARAGRATVSTALAGLATRAAALHARAKRRFAPVLLFSVAVGEARRAGD